MTKSVYFKAKANKMPEVNSEIICTPGIVTGCLMGFPGLIFVHFYHYVTGQRLCHADNTHVGGNGTYTRNGYISACLTGIVKVTQQPDKVRNNISFPSFNALTFFLNSSVF